MNFLKYTSLTCLLALSLPSFAATTTSTRLVNMRQIESEQRYVVMPGTRLVAGNRAQNEFYILGANPKIPTWHSEARAPVAVTKPKAKLAAHAPITKIKLAAKHDTHNHKIKLAAKETRFSKIKLAIRHGFSKQSSHISKPTMIATKAHHHRHPPKRHQKTMASHSHKKAHAHRQV